MPDRHIIELTDVKLITCVLQNGLAEEVLEAAKNVGVQGATVSFARGTGIRDRMGLMGVTVDEQKEVIKEGKSITNVETVIASILLVENLRIQKN
mgnify:CR=1 FL=1